MTSTADTRPVVERALAAPTLCAAFQIIATLDESGTALQNHGGSERVSWGEYADRVRDVARGLAGIGVGPDRTVALLLRNRPTFNIVDTAVLHVGGVPFSLYHTEPVEQMVALVTDSGARVIVTEPPFLDKVRAVVAQCPAVEHVVVDGPVADGDRELKLAELQRSPAAGFDFEATWRAVDEEAVATLVYTSGTTGKPKAVQISHRAVMNSLRGVDHFVVTSPHRGVSFLPAAHITDRFICHYSLIGLGGMLTCVPDPDDLWDAIRATRPTRFFGVPRTCEKLADQARALIADDPGRRRALEVGYARVRAEQGSGPPLDSDGTRAAAEARTELAPIREQLGLDQVQWFAVAAAPTAYEVLEFHHALGMELAELWGMTEFMMATMNPPDRIKLGTVGIPLPTVEADIAPDGEFLLRGGHACSGYRNDPEQTAEMLDAEGWVHTGDLASRDDDGYLRIIGRKKEQMINSSGKNMFPVKIESAVLQSSSLIAHVAAIGDRRRFVTALVVLGADKLTGFAAERGLEGTPSDLLVHAEVRAEVQRAVDAGNERLARVEQIRAWTIVHAEWAPGGPELTNTLKLRRSAIDERYADLIEAMYE